MSNIAHKMKKSNVSNLIKNNEGGGEWLRRSEIMFGGVLFLDRYTLT